MVFCNVALLKQPPNIVSASYMGAQEKATMLGQLVILPCIATPEISIPSLMLVFHFQGQERVRKHSGNGSSAIYLSSRLVGLAALPTADGIQHFPTCNPATGYMHHPMPPGQKGLGLHKGTAICLSRGGGRILRKEG